MSFQGLAEGATNGVSMGGFGLVCREVCDNPSARIKLDEIGSLEHLGSHQHQ